MRAEFLIVASLLVLAGCGRDDEKAAVVAPVKAEQPVAAQLQDPEEVLGNVAREVGLTHETGVMEIGQAAREAIAAANPGNADPGRSMDCNVARMSQDAAGIAASC